MVGTIGMGADRLEAHMSTKAANIGEQLISVAQIAEGVHEQGTWVGAVLNNPHGRRVVAQILGSAYIDDWRLMNVNREAIDQASEALIAQGGELMGDEVTGLLDSVGLRAPTEADAYPPDLPMVPDHRPSIAASEQTA
jgi:hypothetical protein